MLYESQLKWTNFSYDVVRNCKELIMAMEQAGLTEYQLFENQNVRHLENIKVRIHKYDMFLKNNSKELNAKGYGLQQPPQQP
jgi:predicted translin family RNA/ssDNA-binding protein